MGLLKRIPNLLIINNLPELKDDLEGFKFIVNLFNSNMDYFLISLEKKLPLANYEMFQTDYFLEKEKEFSFSKNYIYNNIFKEFTKNIYLENILCYHSINMNMLSNLLFKNKSNFKL